MMLTYNQTQMIYWITEREKIRLDKELGFDKPWSTNPVMQSVYFCNVNREDDKTTMWIRRNWTYDFDKKYYTVAMIVARIFNLPTTLQDIGQPCAPSHRWLDDCKQILMDISCMGNKVWSGAYIISTNGRKISKAEYCIGLIRKMFTQCDILDGATTLEEAHKRLMTIEGLGSFLAAQVVADLKNSKGHPLASAPDWWTFSAPGPGSLRGLGWFFETRVRPKDYSYHIDRAYQILKHHLGEEDVWDVLCMQNLQNCFCEYDKFMRVTNETGRSKRKYNGV